MSRLFSTNLSIGFEGFVWFPDFRENPGKNGDALVRIPWVSTGDSRSPD
jgi:hypothetical protein